MGCQGSPAVELPRLALKAVDCVLRAGERVAQEQLLWPAGTAPALERLRQLLDAVIKRGGLGTADAAALAAAEELLSYLIEVKAVLVGHVATRNEGVDFLPVQPRVLGLAGSLRDISRAVRAMAAHASDEAAEQAKEVGDAIAKHANELVAGLARALRLPQPLATRPHRSELVRDIARRLAEGARWTQLGYLTSGAWSQSGEADESELERLLDETSLPGATAQPEPAVPARDVAALGVVRDACGCSVCHRVMRVPVMFTGTGQSYCKACADDVVRHAKEGGRTPTDPLTRQELAEEVPYERNYALQRLIDGLRSFGLGDGPEPRVGGGVQGGGPLATSGAQGRRGGGVAAALADGNAGMGAASRTSRKRPRS